MAKKKIIFLGAGGILAAVVLFFVFGGGVSGGSLLVGQISGIFQDLFGRPKPDRVIWLDQEKNSEEFSSAALNQPVAKKNSGEKSAPVVFCSFDNFSKSAANGLLINEIAWMGNADNSSAEWAELKNNDSAALAVGGYQLIDKAAQIQFIFPKGLVLPPNSFYVLARENQGVKANAFYGGILGNNGEGLRLFNNNCELIDGVLAEKNWPAGDNENRKTMERTAAGSWQTSAIVGGTPGRENSVSISAASLPAASSAPIALKNPAPVAIKPAEKIQTPPVQNQPPAPQAPQNNPAPDDQNQSPAQQPPAPEPAPMPEPEPETPPAVVLAPVLISEIMVGKDGNSNYEFVELYNPNNESFVLTGWSLKKKNSNGNETALVTAGRLEGMAVPANGHFLLANEEGYDGAVVADIGWPKSYTLAYANNAIVLYDSNNQKITEVGWSEIAKDKSYERRSPDTNDFFVQDSPNPQNSR